MVLEPALQAANQPSRLRACPGRACCATWAHPALASPLAPELEELLVAVGRAIAKLHDGGLVHGDLTTSNMMLRTADRQLVGAGGSCELLLGSNGGLWADRMVSHKLAAKWVGQLARPHAGGMG